MPTPAEIARRTIEIVNASGSVDEAMKGLESLLHPDIEWVNPEDAIEGGIRRGLTGMRLVFDNFFAGFGGASTVDVEEVEGRGDRALVVGRPHVRGESSGADVLGQQLGVIFSIENGLITRIEWHWNIDEARARFEQVS